MEEKSRAKSNIKDKGLVSICIPTYNRAFILNQMLESITNETLFQQTSKVEIVISDNCSTDNTFSVCQKYVQLYPNKVFYSRNEENIGGDANFIKVLSLAHNKLLKLCNDTCIFRTGALEKIVNVAEVCESEKPVVFFTNKMRKKYINGTFCYCNSLNEFIAKIGHRMTWTGSFAIWKDDLAQFDDIARCVKLQLFQTDVILRQMELKGKAFINNESLFEVPICANKGGYNPAIVFGVNYLTKLHYPYVEKGLLSKRVYENEKKRVLKDTTIPYCVDINSEYSFESEGFFEILKPIYGKNFYFYRFLASAYLHKFINNHFYPIISYFDCLKVNLKLNFYQVLKNKSKVDKYKQRLNILKLNYAQRSSK